MEMKALRRNPRKDPTGHRSVMFQPFLRFYTGVVFVDYGIDVTEEFQPFLRFYRSCWAVFWVFKFFGSFLEPRRPPWERALHSRMTALGRGEAPFFGVAQRSCG